MARALRLGRPLEAQPCEDCISREAVIEHICEAKECYKEECKGRTLERCPDLQWVFDLPSVQPQPKRGKWIGEESLDGSIRYMCDNCKEFEYVNYYDFCPNCGADMREVRVNERKTNK